MELMKKLLLISSLVVLAGCAHVVSPALRAEADKTLSPEVLFYAPDAHEGKTVILGGVIIGVKNTSGGASLDALEKPLDSRGRPRDTDVSRGRFVVYHPRHLDPAIYAPGREITVVGKVLGSEPRQLDEVQYPYLMLLSRKLFLHLTTSKKRAPEVHFGFGIFKAF